MQSYIFFRNQTTIPRNFTVATAENILPQIARIFTNSAWCVGSPTDCTDRHRLLGCVGAPTEATDLTEPLAWEEAPTDCTDFHRTFCSGRGSYRLHGFSQMLTSGGALVSSAPSKIRCCTSCLVGALETSAPPERHPNNLCRVKSVGEYPQQVFLC